MLEEAAVAEVVAEAEAEGEVVGRVRAEEAVGEAEVVEGRHPRHPHAEVAVVALAVRPHVGEMTTTTTVRIPYPSTNYSSH